MVFGYFAAMTAVPFDTLKMARKLEAAGFPAGQASGAAEAMVDAMTGADLATKADLTSEIRSLKIDLENKVDRLETKIDRVESRLDGKIELLRRDMTIRLGAMLIASTSIVLTAMRFMPLHP